jgi:predicted ATPase
MIGDTEVVHRHGIEMFDVIRTHRLTFWEDMGSLHVAVNRHAKTSAEAVADVKNAISVWQQKYGARILLPEILCRIAETLLDEGSTSDADHALTEAATLMESNSELYWQPELYRLRGRLAAMVTPDEPKQAVAEYERAIAIAHERNTRLLELRAATGLARLLVDRGDEARAKEVISPVYEWFGSGFDKPDLVEAKALLDALG